MVRYGEDFFFFNPPKKAKNNKEDWKDNVAEKLRSFKKIFKKFSEIRDCYEAWS